MVRLGTKNVWMDAPATAVTIAYIAPRWSPGEDAEK